MDPTSLPMELFLRIASFLPSRELIRAQRVSQTWRFILSDLPHNMPHLMGRPHSQLNIQVTNEHIVDPQLKGDRLAISITDGVRLINLKERTWQDYPVTAYQIILTDTAIGILAEDFHIFIEEHSEASVEVHLPGDIVAQGCGEGTTFIFPRREELYIVEKGKLTILPLPHIAHEPLQGAFVRDGHCFVITSGHTGTVMIVDVALSTHKCITYNFPNASWQLNDQFLSARDLTRLRIQENNGIYLCGLFAVQLDPLEIIDMQTIGTIWQHRVVWQDRVYSRADAFGSFNGGPGSIIQVQDIEGHVLSSIVHPRGPTREIKVYPHLLINKTYLVDQSSDGTVRVFTFDSDRMRDGDKVMTTLYKDDFVQIYNEQPPCSSLWIAAGVNEIMRLLEFRRYAV